MHVAKSQWRQIKAVCNPFPKLPDPAAGQFFIQFRLTEQHNLQQLVFVSFKI